MKNKTRCRVSYGSGSAKLLIMIPGLFVEPLDHNRQHAIPLPVMMGMMMGAVRVMCSHEAHKVRRLYRSIWLVSIIMADLGATRRVAKKVAGGRSPRRPPEKHIN